MKNLLTIIVSVLLSVVVVWLLLPKMEQYYAEKGVQAVTVTQEKTAPEQPKPGKASTVKQKPTKAKATQKSTAKSTATQVSNDKNAITVKSVNMDWLHVRFSLLNNTTKPINGVKVRIIYYNANGEQIHYKDINEYDTLEPGLAKSFETYRSSEAAEAEKVTVQVISYRTK